MKEGTFFWLVGCLVWVSKEGESDSPAKTSVLHHTCSTIAHPILAIRVNGTDIFLLKCKMHKHLFKERANNMALLIKKHKYLHIKIPSPCEVTTNAF